jgi:8-oxo-dGTP pyrophosphatase MutT (NUDIX family)
MTTPAPLSDQPEAWPVVSSTDLYRDDWVVALRKDAIRRPDRPEDEPFTRLVMEHPGAVIVLAVDEQERVLCLRQYRQPAQRRFIELPAGLCDGGEEDPLQVAQRELREEAAMQAREWTKLSSTYSSPGISAEVMHFYLARDLRPAERGTFVLEHEEADMELFWAPYDDVLTAAGHRGPARRRPGSGRIGTALGVVVSRRRHKGVAVITSRSHR